VSSSRVPIDKQSRDAYLAQINVAKAVRKTGQDAGIDRTLVELINIRVSQINGCSYCLDVHVRDAVRQGESAQRIAVLPAWRDTTLFTAVERAALALAESVTTLPDARTQELDYLDARAHLNPDQLSAVCWIAITMNAFNRISIVSRHPVRPESDASDAQRPAPAERATV
jgi:AhpD family alkylhydroperoxidase